MPYSAEVSRGSPSCIVFLIDQSASMEDPFGGQGAGKSKAECVADAINRLLQNLVIKCAKAEGVRDYYDVGVFGYGKRVGPAFGGALSGKDLVPISTIADNPARVDDRTRKVDDGAGGILEERVKFPVWFDATAQNGTPMCEAFRRAADCLAVWTAAHQRSFPPIVINITDGESTDGDPTEAADAVRACSTVDGGALLFNVHLSSHRGNPVEFPDSETALPDRFAKLLFAISSPLPGHLRSAAEAEGYNIGEGSRGFVFNGDIVSVIRFLDIGTRPSNLR